MSSTVLHYVQQWLPLSEQFVHGHVSRSRHGSVVVSRRAPVNEAAFPHPCVRSLHLLPGSGSVVSRRLTTAALVAIALRHRVGAVHVHFGYRLADVAGLRRRLGLPVVVSLHGHDATAYAAEHPAHYGDDLASAAAVIVPSRFLAGAAVALGARRDRVHVVPAGVDCAWFTPSPLPMGAPTVAFVGRFVEKKGIDVLLRAWPAVLAAIPDARLSLLGDGPLRSAVSGKAVDIVEPDPSRRAAQVREHLAAARVVVSPSRVAADGDVESLLVVNLEAQASGRPVVTTRHGGIPEFVSEGETALVVAEDDDVALARALISLLSNGELAARMGAAGPAWATRFDVTRCAAALDDVYDSLDRTTAAA